MGFFDKLKAGLKKTKDSIAAKLQSVAKSFRKIDEEFFEQLEETLILSDFGAKTAADICERLRVEAKKQGKTDAVEVVGLMRGIIADLLGGGNELKTEGHPVVVLMIGVNGAGKTTSCGKLAAWYKSQGKSVLVAAADTFRAAAIDQLQTWVERAGVRMIRKPEGSDPASVVYDACAAAKAENADVLIIDTAGRLHNKKNLMEELRKIARIARQQLPEAAVETLLVLDATTGQNAVSQAKLFGEVAEISGIVLTKLDGTAKGGIIVSIRNELGYSVKLAGVGEKIDDLQPFDALAFAEAVFPDDMINQNESEQAQDFEETEPE
jgi:fused signal recognition particle receptor